MKILGKVLVLHGKVHGALETLVASINDFPRQPIQSLLYIQIVIGIVEIIVSEPYFLDTHTHTHKKATTSDSLEMLWCRRIRIYKSKCKGKRVTVFAKAFSKGFHVHSRQPVLLGIDKSLNQRCHGYVSSRRFLLSSLTTTKTFLKMAEDHDAVIILKRYVVCLLLIDFFFYKKITLLFL